MANGIRSHEYEDLGEIEITRKVYQKGEPGDPKKGIKAIPGGFIEQKVKRHMVMVWLPNGQSTRMDYADAQRLELLNAPVLIDPETGDPLPVNGETSYKQMAMMRDAVAGQQKKRADTGSAQA